MYTTSLLSFILWAVFGRVGRPLEQVEVRTRLQDSRVVILTARLPVCPMPALNHLLLGHGHGHEHGHGGHGPAVAMDGEMQSQHGAAKPSVIIGDTILQFCWPFQVTIVVSQYLGLMSRTKVKKENKKREREG